MGMTTILGVMTLNKKESYSDRKSSYEGKLVIGQTLMLLSLISLPFAFMIHVSLLILSAILLGLGIKVYFDAKQALKKARERFLQDEVQPRLKKEMSMDFYPDEGLSKDFFEGSETLKIKQAYESFQRFEMEASHMTIEGAFVRTGPKPRKLDSTESDALFSGKVIHVVFDKAFRFPVTLTDHTAENAVPFGTLFAIGEKAEAFALKAKAVEASFDTFNRKHGGGFKAVMQDRHLYLFVHDHRPFIDLAPSKPMGEPPIRFFKTFIDDVLALSNALYEQSSML